MRYLDTNVSDWFRDQLADLIVAVLRDEGTISKGALIGMVMRRRGLEPNQGNIRMRAHVDEMERRGVLISQRSLMERHPIMIRLAEAAEDGGSEGIKCTSSVEETMSVARDANPPSTAARNLLQEAIASIALRMGQMAENVATQNEAIGMFMRERETFVLRQEIAGLQMILDSVCARLEEMEEANVSRHYARPINLNHRKARF